MSTIYSEKQKKYINKIKVLWQEHIDSKPSWSMLNKILRELVIDEQYDVEYVWFAIDYCIKTKRKLRYPAGLRYIVQDNKIISAYNNALISNNVLKERHEITIDNVIPFVHKSNKPRGFNDVLRR